MKKKALGVGYTVFGLMCLYYCNYWFLHYTDKSLYHLLYQFSYFTNQTIILCGIYCICLGLCYLGCTPLQKLVFNSYIKVGITTYILMVSIGYYIGVARFCLVSWDELYIAQPHSIFMHLIAPIVMALIYNTTPMEGKVIYPTFMWLSVYPMGYLIFANLYSMVTGNYIYPILNPDIMGSHLEIPIAVFGGCILFWIIGFLVGARNNFCLDHNIGVRETDL